MAFLSTFLMSLTISCLVWVVFHWINHGQLMTQRMTGAVSGGSVKHTTVTMEGLLKSERKRQGMLKSTFLSKIRGEKPLSSHEQINVWSWAAAGILLIYFSASDKLGQNQLLVLILLAVILPVSVRLIERARENQRERKILRLLPQFVDLLVIAVEAGLSFLAALEKILKEMHPSEPLTQELRLMHHEILSGVPLAEACEHLSKRHKIPDLAMLLNSITQSDQIGTSLGATLRMQASEIRDKYRQRVRTRVLKIPIKILFPMMFTFLAFMLLNLAIIFYQLQKVMGEHNPTSDLSKMDADHEKGKP